MKKYRSERKGRRTCDTAMEYGTGAMVAREKTRTAKAAVRATRCAEHVRQLGGESPLPNLMEVKG